VRAALDLAGHRPLAGEPEQKAHGQRHGQQRGAAIGDKRQRHALGGEQADIDRHVDQGLQAEQHDEAGHGMADEAVGLLRGLGQAAQHDEGKKIEQDEAGDQAVLLGGHRKDKVGVGVGQHVLHRALARAPAEPAAMQEGVERSVGLIGVARSRIEEAVDARGDVRHEEIGREDTGDARGAERPDPHHIDAGHVEQCAPHQRDE